MKVKTKAVIWTILCGISGFIAGFGFRGLIT